MALFSMTVRVSCCQSLALGLGKARGFFRGMVDVSALSSVKRSQWASVLEVGVCGARPRGLLAAAYSLSQTVKARS